MYQFFLIFSGEEIHDSYGAVYYHMEKAERIQYLKVGFTWIGSGIEWHQKSQSLSATVFLYMSPPAIFTELVYKLFHSVIDHNIRRAAD